MTTNKKILQIALPLIFASLGYSIVSATDTLFLGRTGDTLDLAAIGLMSPFYLVITLLGFSFSRGGQILIARRVGENNPKKVGTTAQNMMSALMITALVLFLLMKFEGRWILSLFVDTPELLTACTDYLEYRIDGIFFSYFGIVFIAFYSGIGKTKVVLYNSVILVVVNLILNYGLIYGNWGMPEMGIAGAGLASALSEIVAAIGFFIVILMDKKIGQYHLFKRMPLDFENIKVQLKLSTPIALQSSLGVASWVAFFGLVENLGQQALAVSSVIRVLYLFLGVPAWGLASATNTIISNLIGSNDKEDVLPTLRKIVVISIIITVFISLSLLVFPEAVVMIVTNDLSVVQDTIPLLQLLFAILIGYAVYNIYFNGIVGAGAINVSLSLQIFSVFAYLTYIYLIIMRLSGSLFLAWSAEFVHAVIIIFFSIWYLRSNKWHQVKV